MGLSKFTCLLLLSAKDTYIHIQYKCLPPPSPSFFIKPSTQRTTTNKQTNQILISSLPRSFPIPLLCPKIFRPIRSVHDYRTRNKCYCCWGLNSDCLILKHLTYPWARPFQYLEILFKNFPFLQVNFMEESKTNGCENEPCASKTKKINLMVNSKHEWYGEKIWHCISAMGSDQSIFTYYRTCKVALNTS